MPDKHREKMKAVVIHAFGGPEVLNYEEIDIPQAGPLEVLIRVQAAGVNPVDWKTRTRPFRPTQLPLIPGWDISGVVEQVGSSVVNFKPGDAVYGLIRFPAPGAAYAEYTTAPVGELAPKPTSLDHPHAAALPLVALTAWQALFEKAELKAGQTVFVNGAAGGVGHIGVQLAKAAGARVIGTASSGKFEFLESLGVDEPIDYKAMSLEALTSKADIYLDTVGNGFVSAIQIIKPGGTFVSIAGGMQSSEEAGSKNIRVIGHLVYPNASQLSEIAKLVDQGKVRPVVAATFPLAQAKQAHLMSESQRTSGKIVLTTL